MIEYELLLIYLYVIFFIVFMDQLQVIRCFCIIFFNLLTSSLLAIAFLKNLDLLSLFPFFNIYFIINFSIFYYICIYFPILFYFELFVFYLNNTIFYILSFIYGLFSTFFIYYYLLFVIYLLGLPTVEKELDLCSFKSSAF